jgi:hypothetical protein
MNALLASGEVPGLFEGDDLTNLMNMCRERDLREGGGGNGDEEIWHNFVKTVQRNLHVIFTMNPSGDDFSNRSTTSPALFNRCVVDWFGTWGVTALGQVGHAFTAAVDMGVGEQNWAGVGAGGEGVRLLGNVESAFGGDNEGPNMRQAVVAALCDIHEQVKGVCALHNKTAMCVPRERARAPSFLCASRSSERAVEQPPSFSCARFARARARATSFLLLRSLRSRSRPNNLLSSLALASLALAPEQPPFFSCARFARVQ